MRGEPMWPHDSWAQQFYSAKEWRAAAEQWETLAAGAEAEGDDKNAEMCSENAAQCRYNARVKELEGSDLSSADAPEETP